MVMSDLYLLMLRTKMAFMALLDDVKCNIN